MSKTFDTIKQVLLEEPRLSPDEAHRILKKHNALDKDFHTLGHDSVEGLLDSAKEAKYYHKSKNAPGSTARMFHQHLSRLAQKSFIGSDDRYMSGKRPVKEETIDEADTNPIIRDRFGNSIGRTMVSDANAKKMKKPKVYNDGTDSDGGIWGSKKFSVQVEKPKKEETQIDELSSATKDNYVRGALKDIRTKGYPRDAKSMKRREGIFKAERKLSEENLHETSSNKIANYINTVRKEPSTKQHKTGMHTAFSRLYGMSKVDARKGLNTESTNEKSQIDESKNKIYVGLKKGGTGYEVFHHHETPTEKSHGHLYGATIGPFRTRKAADFMASPAAHNNPHVQTVNDAERIVKTLNKEETINESWGEKHNSFKAFKENAQQFADGNTHNGHVEFEHREVNSGSKNWHQTSAVVEHPDGNLYKTGVFNHTNGPQSEEGFGQHLSRFHRWGLDESVVTEAKLPEADPKTPEGRKRLRSQYNRNENQNRHSENALLLAKHFGTPEEHETAKAFLKKRNAEGQGSWEGSQFQADMSTKHYHKLSEENINEISKKTLGSYVVQAHADASNAEFRTGMAIKTGDNIGVDWGINRSNRRTKGIGKAISKLTKEEMIAELTKKTLGRYIQRATSNLVGHVQKDERENPRKKRFTQPMNVRDMNSHGGKAVKRWAGIGQASDKLSGSARVNATEETQIDESRNLDVTEGQPGKHKLSPYKYVGPHKESGLHVFDDGTGKKEMFAKRKPGSGDAGWHLKRGSHVYEFVRSMNEEVQLISEVSKILMRNYIIKASANAATKASDASWKLARGGLDIGSSDSRKSMKRLEGVWKATSKLTKAAKVDAT